MKTLLSVYLEQGPKLPAMLDNIFPVRSRTISPGPKLRLRQCYNSNANVTIQKWRFAPTLWIDQGQMHVCVFVCEKWMGGGVPTMQTFDFLLAAVERLFVVAYGQQSLKDLKESASKEGTGSSILTYWSYMCSL